MLSFDTAWYLQIHAPLYRRTFTLHIQDVTFYRVLQVSSILLGPNLSITSYDYAAFMKKTQLQNDLFTRFSTI